MPDQPYQAPADPNVGAEFGTESSLSNWVGDYATEMLGRGRALSEMPYQAWQGPLTAGPSPLQEQAFSGIAGLTLPDQFGQAGDMYSAVGQDAAAGGTYDPTVFSSSNMDTPNRWWGERNWTDQGVAESYMNPFIEQALNPQLDEIARQSEIQRQKDASRLTRAGAFGGSRQAIMDSERNDNMARLMNETVGAGYRDAYDRGARIFGSDMDRTARMFQSDADREASLYRDDQSRALEAQRLGEQSRQFGANFGQDALDQRLAAARGIQSLGQDNIANALKIASMQADAGDVQRNIMQQGIDADRAQFETERNYPYKQIQFMQSLLQGMPLQADTVNRGQASNLSNALGGAGGILQLLEILSNRE